MLLPHRGRARPSHGFWGTDPLLRQPVVDDVRRAASLASLPGATRIGLSIERFPCRASFASSSAWPSSPRSHPRSSEPTRPRPWALRRALPPPAAHQLQPSRSTCERGSPPVPGTGPGRWRLCGRRWSTTRRALSSTPPMPRRWPAPASWSAPRARRAMLWSSPRRVRRPPMPASCSADPRPLRQPARSRARALDRGADRGGTLPGGEPRARRNRPGRARGRPR